MYLGFAVQCGTQESVTPFVAPAAPIEYELMRSIRSVSNAIKKKVGILKTDVEIFGGFDMQTFQQKPQWAIAQELTTQYEVVNVDAAADYPSDIDCLIVPQGSSLEQEPMSRLQAYLAAGNPTILFEDPLPVSRGAQGSAADDQKGGAQARMMGQGGPPKGNWNGVLQEIGLRAPVGEIVFDLSYRTFQGGQLPPNYVFVRGDGLSSDSAITSGLQSIVSLMGGHVDSFGKEGFTFTPLLQASGTGTGELNGYMKKADLYRQMNPFTGPEYNEGARKYPSVGNMTMAARIVSKPPEGQPNGVNVIYVADIDLIGDQFFQIRMSQVDANFRFDNVTFALNCIDTLVGDESLIELRKRRPLLRKLTKVEEAQAEFENEWQTQKGAAEDAATESLAAAKNRLSDAVQKIKDNNDLDAQAKQVKIVEVQQNENRKLEIETAQIGERKNRRLEEAQHARDVARDGIHNSYRLITLLLAGLPGLLLGLITYFRRSTRAAAIVPQNRQVGGNN
jgi:ABC-2 type transport system permease protein